LRDNDTQFPPMRLGMAVIIYSLAATAAAQQMPIIRVPVHLVTAPTLVFSKEGRLSPNLRKTDFRVFDNSRLQTVELDTNSAPVSIAVAVQVNRDVREYVPFIAKAGSLIEALLAGESGEAAVITYAGNVAVVKPFDSGDVQSALRNISADGSQARMVDAGVRAINLLRERPGSRVRVLLFIGQPMDSGSESALLPLKEQAERENISIYALALPELGKTFVSDTFALDGVSRGERGGFRAGVDLGKLIAVLRRSSDVEKRADPFSILTAATGGTQFHFRKQSELESALATVGVELRSGYVLSYYPSSTETGYHAIRIEVDVPGAHAYARPGYWMSAN
jgi:VWFA-related protein